MQNTGVAVKPPAFRTARGREAAQASESAATLIRRVVDTIEPTAATIETLRRTLPPVEGGGDHAAA